MVFWEGRRKKALRICSIALLGWGCTAKAVPSPDPVRGALVFTEVMPDPDPPVGLPPVEYVEVLNRSSDTVALKGWSFGYGEKTYPCPSCQVPPDGFVLLCSKYAASELMVPCPVLSLTSFPTLANSDRVIWLSDPQGMVVTSLHYLQGWYGSAFKADGGWSLECIDPDNLSGDATNWTASVDPSGGTPGRRNSVYRSNQDTRPPHVQHLAVPDALTLECVFSKGLDPIGAADLSRYRLLGGQSFLTVAEPVAPLFRRVRLHLGRPLQAGVYYTCTVSGLASAGGLVMPDTTLLIGLPLKPDSFDLSLNELLFNPVGEGYDYVECVNRSARCLDLSSLSLTSRDAHGRLRAAIRLTDERIPALPGTYWVLSVSGESLAKTWASDSLGRFLTLSSMPSMPDDMGSLVLMTTDGRVIDDVTYSAQWHLELMSDKEGVALEKIHPDLPSDDPASWVSASFVGGYGSPGLRNTQYWDVAYQEGVPITLAQSWLTPDGDGDSDALCLRLDLKQPAQLTLTVYDVLGRVVCHWMRNEWMGLQDRCCWEGTDDQGRLLPQGRYVLLAVLCRPDGWVHQAKWGVSLWW